MKRTILLTFVFTVICCFFAIHEAIAQDEKTEIKQRIYKLSRGNKAEVEKAILHYEQINDSLKLDALLFLLDNMGLHHTDIKEIHPDPAVVTLFNYADSLYYNVFRDQYATVKRPVVDNYSLVEIKKTIQQKKIELQFSQTNIEYASNLDYVNQLMVVESRKLISHIDHLFEQKEKSKYLQSLSFSEFCTYMLPLNLVDHIPYRKSMVETYNLFNKYFVNLNEMDFEQIVARYNQLVTHFGFLLGDYPIDNLSGFEESFYSGVKMNDCFFKAVYFRAAMCSLGVPIGIYYNIAYKTFQGRHSLCFLKSNSERWTTFDPIYQTPSKMYGNYHRTPEVRKMASIVQLHYNVQQNNPFSLKGINEAVPSDLESPFIEEATTKLIQGVSTTLSINYKTDNKLCYLATFNSRAGLVPITWGLIDKSQSSVTFENTIVNTLYFPVVYEEGELRPVGDPFMVMETDGAFKTRIFTKPRADYSSMKLTRKFPEKQNLRKRAESLIGSYLLAFNEVEGQKDTLFKLDFIPKTIIQQVSLNNKKAYRYYELHPAKSSYLNEFSEIEFITNKSYGYSNVVDAKSLPRFSPTDKCDSDNLARLLDRTLDETKRLKIYDGSMETAQEERIVKFHLEKSQVVTDLRFAPLNANNGINPGNKYLLLYWDGTSWKEYGSGVDAVHHYLGFKNVPSSALYWLKNLSGGREELPFYLDDSGNQVFVYSVGE